MERVTKEHEETINHFSHPHPLELSNFQAQKDLQTLSITCLACKLKPSDWIYSCATCEFFLHAKCSHMPKQITHPYHNEHVLSLLSKPLNPTESSTCDACQKSCNDGFVYNCIDCKCNLHMLCAVIPLFRSHNGHPHELKLTFDIPNSHVYFQCDICQETAYNQWFYWCSSCDFCVHPCCINRSPVIVQTASRHIAKSQSGARLQPSRSTSQFEPFVSTKPTNPGPRVNAPSIQGHTGPLMATRPLNPEPMYPSRYTQPLHPSPMYPTMYPIPQPMHFMPQTPQNHQRMVLQQAIQQLSRANSIQNRVAIDMLQSMVEGLGNGAMQSLMQPSGGVLGQDMFQGLSGGGDMPIPGVDGFGGLDGLLGGLSFF